MMQTVANPNNLLHKKHQHHMSHVIYICIYSTAGFVLQPLQGLNASRHCQRVTTQRACLVHGACRCHHLHDVLAAPIGAHWQATTNDLASASKRPKRRVSLRLRAAKVGCRSQPPSHCSGNNAVEECWKTNMVEHIVAIALNVYPGSINQSPLSNERIAKKSANNQFKYLVSVPDFSLLALNFAPRHPWWSHRVSPQNAPGLLHRRCGSRS